jgi:hypothetical protein
MSVPSEVRLAPSLQGKKPQPLSDADLYLAELQIPELHVEIKEALAQAVQCFRHDLFVPCLAMLAKASEGAWTELGLSLLEVDVDNPNLKREKRDKIQQTLTSPDASMVKKIRTVLELYDRQDVFSEVRKRSGFDNRALTEVSLWANIVRDSRNAVHYGASPSTTNTYEKVAALLLGASHNLRLMYSIRKAAEDLSKEGDSNK